MEPGVQDHWSKEASQAFIDGLNAGTFGPTRFSYEMSIPRSTLMYWTRGDVSILRGLANANPEVLGTVVICPFAELPDLTQYFSCELQAIGTEGMRDRFDRRYDHHQFFLRNPGFPWNTPYPKPEIQMDEEDFQNVRTGSEGDRGFDLAPGAETEGQRQQVRPLGMSTSVLPPHLYYQDPAHPTQNLPSYAPFDGIGFTNYGQVLRHAKTTEPGIPIPEDEPILPFAFHASSEQSDAGASSLTEDNHQSPGNSGFSDNDGQQSHYESIPGSPIGEEDDMSNGWNPMSTPYPNGDILANALRDLDLTNTEAFCNHSRIFDFHAISDLSPFHTILGEIATTQMQNHVHRTVFNARMAEREAELQPAAAGDASSPMTFVDDGGGPVFNYLYNLQYPPEDWPMPESPPGEVLSENEGNSGSWTSISSDATDEEIVEERKVKKVGDSMYSNPPIIEINSSRYRSYRELQATHKRLILPREETKRNYLCVFCKGNHETPDVYRSHPIRIDGVVTCPNLRKHVCVLCGATGDAAHTVKYCPNNKRGFFATKALQKKKLLENKAAEEEALEQSSVLEGKMEDSLAKITTDTEDSHTTITTEDSHATTTEDSHATTTEDSHATTTEDSHTAARTEDNHTTTITEDIHTTTTTGDSHATTATDQTSAASDLGLNEIEERVLEAAISYDLNRNYTGRDHIMNGLPNPARSQVRELRRRRGGRRNKRGGEGARAGTIRVPQLDDTD